MKKKKTFTKEIIFQKTFSHIVEHVSVHDFNTTDTYRDFVYFAFEWNMLFYTDTFRFSASSDYCNTFSKYKTANENKASVKKLH